MFFIGTFIYLFIYYYAEGAHAYHATIHYTTTPLVKKRHLTLAHNFTKYWPIFKILSLLDSVGNL